MKNYKIAFLRMAIGLIFILPVIASVLWLPKLPNIFYLVLITLIPFLSAVFRAKNLLALIEQGDAFSDSSVLHLEKISFSALFIALFYFLASIFLVIFSYKISFTIISVSFFFTSFSICVFSSVLSELMGNALKIKSENDLTI